MRKNGEQLEINSKKENKISKKKRERRDVIAISKRG